MTFVKKAVIAVAAIFALAACQTMNDMMSSGKTVQVSLTGGEEVPSVSSSASGKGSFTIADDGAVKGSVTTTGVAGTMAHIHRGAKGQNGPVAVGLVKNGDTYSVPDGAKLNEADLKLFKAGSLYVNVHSNANKAGEIRAQLQP